LHAQTNNAHVQMRQRNKSV